MTALTSTIEFLKALVGDRAITPSCPDYNDAKNQHWSSACWEAASCYVLLQSREEVSHAIKIISETGCPFSVRATGHNPNPGFSSIAGGVVLDLGGLKEKKLSGDKRVASVGAGCRWGEVYGWLEGEELSVIGGRDPAVGMGLLLGGGYSAVPNLYGAPSDNVENFEVVLSNGSIVNANSTENADLFQALKGGGTNFGIVTRFDLKTHPLINLQFQIRLYRPAEYMAINKATLALQDEMERDPNIGAFTNYNPLFAAIGVAYAGYKDREVDDLFEKHFAHVPGLLDTACPTTNGTVISLCNILAHGSGDQKKRYVGTVTTRCTESIYASVHGAWRDMMRTLPEGVVLHYTVQPIGTACVEYGDSRGGNILGLEKKTQCWWVFTVEWPDTKDISIDNAARGAVDGFVQRVEDAARESRGYLPYLAANFARSSSDVLGGYREGNFRNFRKIQDAARKYDPEGVFQKQQGGGFLIRDSEA